MAEGKGPSRNTAETDLPMIPIAEMERRLAEEKELFRDLTESIGDWVWEMDLNGIHTYSNDAVKKILGYGSEEIVGMDSMLLWPEKVRTDTQRKDHLGRLAEGKGWINFQALFEHKKGHPVYVLSSAVPLFDENGKLKGYRGIDRDINERVKKDRELEDSKEQLDLINKILRHDLTNNLTVIGIALDHYKREGDQSMLDSAEAKVYGSFKLIDQMKSLESIISKGGALRSVDVHDIVEKISSNLDIEVENQCHCRVMADDAFHSLVENLIRNAIKHGGTDRMVIRCLGDQDGEGIITLDVIDFGIGIPNNIKEKIFGEGFTHGGGGGSGLGLYIVERTLLRYGGSISVHDNEPNGAVFRLRLKKGE